MSFLPAAAYTSDSSNFNMPLATRRRRTPPPTERRARVFSSKISSASRLAAPMLAILYCLLSGCDVSYVARGGYEAMRLLWNRKPISSELASGDISRDTRDKLETVLRVRDFARDKLGLKVGGA